jgi:flagellar L-ring protein precursor FlgH
MSSRTGSVAISLVVLSASVAGAQTAPAGTNDRVTRRQSPPSAISGTQLAEETAAMIKRTGGSLLQAQQTLEAASAGPVAVGFLNVPEPEPKTLKKHDLLTIVINEESEITSKGTNNMSRDSEFDAKVSNFVAFKPKSLTLLGLQSTTTPEVNLSGKRSFQGEGEVDRSDSFTARITAEVVDVKPNGTVILQARKRIKTDEEEQQFILTGTCRAEDVTAANTILSSQMFDLELQKNHKGDVRNATKRGVLGKLLDVINPF